RLNGRPEIFHDTRLEIDQAQPLGGNHQGCDIDGYKSLDVVLVDVTLDEDGRKRGLRVAVEVGADEIRRLKRDEVDADRDAAVGRLHVVDEDFEKGGIDN